MIDEEYEKTYEELSKLMHNERDDRKVALLAFFMMGRIYRGVSQGVLDSILDQAKVLFDEKRLCVKTDIT